MKKNNISTNRIRVIKNLYNKATSAVLFNSSIGDWFRTTVGVRMGCLLSPTLYDIFLERIMTDASPRSEKLRRQKLKSHLVRTQSLNVLPLKPGVGTCMLRLLPGISSLLISTFPVHSPAFFPKHLPIFFPVLALANIGSCVGP